MVLNNTVSMTMLIQITARNRKHMYKQLNYLSIKVSTVDCGISSTVDEDSCVSTNSQKTHLQALLVQRGDIPRG